MTEGKNLEQANTDSTGIQSDIHKPRVVAQGDTVNIYNYNSSPTSQNEEEKPVLKNSTNSRKQGKAPNNQSTYRDERNKYNENKSPRKKTQNLISLATWIIITSFVEISIARLPSILDDSSVDRKKGTSIEGSTKNEMLENTSSKERYLPHSERANSSKSSSIDIGICGSLTINNPTNNEDISRTIDVRGNRNDYLDKNNDCQYYVEVYSAGELQLSKQLSFNKEGNWHVNAVKVGNEKEFTNTQENKKDFQLKAKIGVGCSKERGRDILLECTESSYTDEITVYREASNH